MKTETINCDRCGVQIPDGPPNTWYQNTTVNLWSTNATITRDLCNPCDQDYQTFLANQIVNPRS